MGEKNTGMLASAMNYAIPLGLFWVFKYIFVILGDYAEFSKFIVSILTIVTPVLYYVLLCRYRDVQCEGKLDYGDSILFSLLLFIFASFLELVIMSLHIYIINPETEILTMFGRQIEASAQLLESIMSPDPESYNRTMDLYSSNLRGMFLVNRFFENLMLGLFFSLIVGYFVSKQRPNQSSNM